MLPKRSDLLAEIQGLCTPKWPWIVPLETPRLASGVWSSVWRTAVNLAFLRPGTIRHLLLISVIGEGREGEGREGKGCVREGERGEGGKGAKEREREREIIPYSGKDLSTSRLFYKSVPDDKHSNTQNAKQEYR